MLEIKVYDDGDRLRGTLELAPDATMTMDETSPCFDDNLDNGSYSLPLEAPFTDNNRRALGAAEMLEGIPSSLAAGAALAASTSTGASAALSDQKSWAADARGAGVPFVTRGKLTLLEHGGSFDYKRGNYTLSLAGSESLYGSKIIMKKLSDLELGGYIHTGSYDGREFAAQCYLGNFPQYYYISFAPIYWEGFIDTGREDFTTEALANDTVNNIVINPSFGGVGWAYGRPQPTAPTAFPVASGVAGYEDYRTVPFFNLAFVLKACFAEYGYTAFGDILEDVDFNKIFLFNNYATEIYNTIHQDINRVIYPRNHMPDMLIGEFLSAIKGAFGLALIFLPGNKVWLMQREAPIKNKKTVDLTSRTISTYKATRTEVGLNGATIKWGWDSADGMVGDRIKTVDLSKVIGSGDVLANAVYNLTVTGVEGDLVYVINENYYYQLNSAGAFEFYSEGNLPQVIGSGQKGLEYKVSPLCQLFHYDNGNGRTIQDTCGVRMPGSYVNLPKKQVTSPFGLRIFYIDRFNGAMTSVTGVPTAFTHCLEPSNGIIRANSGLNFSADNGLYPRYHRRWMEAQVSGWSVKANFLMRADETAGLLPWDRKVQVGAVQYMLQHVKKVVGNAVTTVEADLLVV